MICDLFSDQFPDNNAVAYVAVGMATPVEWLTMFRGTRPAQAVSSVIFLGLGLYNLVFDTGGSALCIGIPFIILGLFMSYKFLVASGNVWLNIHLACMKQFYLFHLSLGVTGAVWGLSAVSTILAEGVSLSLGLAGVGGVGLAVVVVYKLATANPDEFFMGRINIILVVVGAVFTLIGAELQLVA